jgi:hypothetical protein
VSQLVASHIEGVPMTSDVCDATCKTDAECRAFDVFWVTDLQGRKVGAAVCGWGGGGVGG